MAYGTSVRLDLPFEQALARTREAMETHGLTVLCEIDLAQAVRDRLGEEVEDLVVLGVCHPTLVRTAMDADPSIGLLLPFNVVVRSEGPRVVVEALDPQLLVQVAGREELQHVADEATLRLEDALVSLL